MTAEEAIKGLKPIVDNEAYTDHFQDVCRTAIEALEKQIPKEPLYKKEEYEDKKCYSKREYYSCPSCNKKLFIQNHKEIRTDTYSDLSRFPQGNRTRCCPDCGQAIDWGEE